MKAQRLHVHSNATVTPAEMTIGETGGLIAIKLRYIPTDAAAIAVAITINKIVALFVSGGSKTVEIGRFKNRGASCSL
jgi:hypothetical protein